jgi:hypothetical protein
MLRYLLVAFFVLVFDYSIRQHQLVIDRKNIQAIVLTAYDTLKFSSARISDKIRVGEITTALNKAKWDPAVFKSFFRLEFIYADGKTQVALCNGKHIKLDGIAYVLNKPVYDVINGR